MIKCGMSYDEVMAMVEAQGWEIVGMKVCEQYGDEWTEVTIWQGDHAVTVSVDDEGVYWIQFIPAWRVG